MVQGVEGSYFLIRINEEEGQLFRVLAQYVIEAVFLETPAFTGKSFDAVTVYCMGKTFCRGAESRLNRIFVHGLIYRHVDNAVWKNRKRFSFPKKRFNEFSAF
jgi:hypothetical protein